MTWRPEPESWQPPRRPRRWFICRGCNTASPGVDTHQAHQRSCLLYGQLIAITALVAGVIGHDENREAARDGSARLADMEGKP